MEVTDRTVEAFKSAWLQANAEGDHGNRVRRGLEAAGVYLYNQGYNEGYDDGYSEAYNATGDSYL